MSQLARIRIGQGCGPSKWGLTLATFDDETPEVRKERLLGFRLDGQGATLWIECELRGLMKPPRPPLPQIWSLFVTTSDLPKGYYPDTLRIMWSAVSKYGHTDLTLTAPCHAQAGLKKGTSELLDGRDTTIYACRLCSRKLIRVNPNSGTEEWLDEYPVWTDQELEPVIRL